MIDFDCDRGRVEIQGIRYLLIQPVTLVGFQKAAEQTGGPVADWLAAGGRAGGRNSSSRLRAARAASAPAEFAQEYLDMGAAIGWGVFRVTRCTVGALEVEVTGSPFAEAYGPSAGPVCHFTRGVIAGLGDTLFGEASCEEISCSAAGATACRFVCRAAP
jgi:predicted hydrocarbon binding protein